MKQFIHVKIQFAFCLMLLIPLLGISQNKPSTTSKQATYPQLKSTGNLEFDKQQHANAVKAWQEGEKLRLQSIKNSKTEAVNVSNKVIVPSKETTKASSVSSVSAGSTFSPHRSNKKQQREITIVDIPGYPKYIATGNSELDNKNYAKAKAFWMDENPEAYEKYVKEHTAKNGNAKRLPAGN